MPGRNGKKSNFTRITPQNCSSILGHEVKTELTYWQQRAVESQAASHQGQVLADGACSRAASDANAQSISAHDVDHQQEEATAGTEASLAVPSASRRWGHGTSGQCSSAGPEPSSALHEQRKKMDEQQKKLNEQQEKIKQLDLKIQDLKTHHAKELQDRDRKHAQELATAHAKVQEQQELVDRLNKELQHGRNLSCQLERERSKIQDLLAEIESLTAKANDSQRLKAQQYRQLREWAGREKELHAAQAQLPAIQDQLEAYQVAVDELQSTFGPMKAQHGALRAEVTSMEQKLGKAADLLAEDSIQFLLPGEQCSYCLSEDKCLTVVCDCCSKRACAKCLSRGMNTHLGPTCSIDKRRRAAELRCPNGDCSGHLPRRIMKLLDDDVLETLEQTRIELGTMDNNVLKEQNTIVQLQKLALKTEVEKSLHLEEQIIRNMLTLRCPGCKAPFESFSACCALTCSRCPCHFCAWCLEASPCHQSNHAHVMKCPCNPTPGELFAKEHVWKHYTGVRINQQVTLYIDSLNSAVASRLRARCKQWMA